MENEITVPEFNEKSRIEKVEEYLISKFQAETKIQDFEKGYLSIPFVNQIVEAEPKIAASMLLIQQLREHDMLDNIDHIVEIPKFGTYLAGTISDRTRIPIAPVSKDGKTRGQWGKIIKLEDAIPSFTTGIPSFYIINGLQAGDRVLLVDDFIAHGETATHFIKGLQEKGVSTVGLVAYLIKYFQPGYQRIIEETGITPFGAVGVDDITEDGNIIFSEPIYAKGSNLTPTP